MAKTREIPREQWLKELDRLSVGNRQRKVTVELESDELGDQVLAENLPLLGIEPELKGSDRCAIDIEVGNQELANAFRMTHSVICATRVWVEEDDNGSPVALDIEGQEPEGQVRIKTIVTFLE